ncbi:MAG: ABC transporter ATP-binding protein [Clostridia bacterium]|nr:ABC transporter ATP-binding protein [Clostridia bacterium]
MKSERTPVLEVKNLSKTFYEKGKGLFQRTPNRAVQGVSFRVGTGETFGIVGESGCGKSTVARLIMGLERPDSGEVFFKGQRIDSLPEGQLRPLRPHFQMVFQDSGSSLNGRKRVRDILSEPMIWHGVAARQDAQARVDALLDMVGLPAGVKERYPHEFSGGQRQRICIARALSLNPDLIILDEPVSALDVSVQAQILNLLRDLQEKLGVSYLFIGHGLGAVRYISHRIGVMYRGRIVETGPSGELFSRPAHPYTRALLDAAPIADWNSRNRPRIVLRGEAAGAGWDGGCAFRGRCPCAVEACAASPCALKQAGGENHLSACDMAESAR